MTKLTWPTCILSSCGGVQPETLGETEANSWVQLQIQQLLGHIFDAVTCVVEL